MANCKSRIIARTNGIFQPRLGYKSYELKSHVQVELQKKIDEECKNSTEEDALLKKRSNNSEPDERMPTKKKISFKPTPEAQNKHKQTSMK